MEAIKSAGKGTVFTPPEKDEASESVGGRQVAKVMERGMVAFEANVAERKKALFSIIPDGATVVEVGIGTGPNLRYMPHGVKVIGIEPNLYMWPECQKKSEELGIQLTLHQGFAENIPVQTASADVVLFTHVLCSVKEQRDALCEAARILKPNGLLLFLEHVLAPSGYYFTRALQYLFNPLQRYICGNCNIIRETGTNIRDIANKTELFDSISCERFDAKFGCCADRLGLLNPHVSGSARRTATPHE